MSEIAELNLPPLAQDPRARRQLVGLFDNLMQLVAMLDDFARFEKSREGLRATLADLDGEVRDRQQQLQALDAQLAVRKKQADTVSAETEAAQAELAATKEALAAAKAELAQQEDRLASVKSEMDRVRARFRA